MTTGRKMLTVNAARMRLYYSYGPAPGHREVETASENRSARNQVVCQPVPKMHDARLRR